MRTTRILIAGDRNWRCEALAGRVVDRLIARYGRDELVIVHGDSRGVASAFAQAAGCAGVALEPHPAEPDEPSEDRNVEMVEAGADLCIAVHRWLPGSSVTMDLIRRAVGVGIPTWLISSERAEPRRIRREDPRLIPAVGAAMGGRRREPSAR